MTKTQVRIISILISSIIIFTIILVQEMKYQSILKHFPNMTRWEYYTLEDRIRIIPNEKF